MTKDNSGKRGSDVFLYSLLFMCFISIVLSFYFFYIKKDYDFIVEVACNPEVETCFYRDCTTPEDCPPNNLSYYTEYTIKASDFKSCGNEDCTEACKDNLITCIKTGCTDIQINDGTCVLPANLNTQN